MEHIAQEIGAKIRYYRRKNHMTIDQLAAAVHKSKSSVSKYESGQTILDVVSLYEIAEALGVDASQLLCKTPTEFSGAPSGTVPAFFANVQQLYMYYFDGRIHQINRSVIDITAELQPNLYQVRMYMNIRDYEHYTHCDHYYEGTMSHFDTISQMTLQNLHMGMELYQIVVPCPYMNAPAKWAQVFGISSRPLMPMSTRVLLSKAAQEETPEFVKSLKISKDDIRLMKTYNMFAVM